MCCWAWWKKREKREKKGGGKEKTGGGVFGVWVLVSADLVGGDERAEGSGRGFGWLFGELDLEGAGLGLG
jgi:hypothetical protein